MDKVFYSLKVEGNYKPSAASRRIMAATRFSGVGGAKKREEFVNYINGLREQLRDMDSKLADLLRMVITK